MFDLTQFSLRDMTQCGSDLRKLGPGDTSMESVAQRIVSYLYDGLLDRSTGIKQCALVRFFKSHPYEALEPELQRVAEPLMRDRSANRGIKCLTLLATAGQLEPWNDRRKSAGHRAIPLPSAAAIKRIPMIAQLIDQLGVKASTVVGQSSPDLLIDAEQRSYNVFYVANALGSPYIPAQEDFVIRYGVRSVLGFGGVLPFGDLFAVVVFSKAQIPRGTTELFAPLALCTKAAVLPFSGGRVFA